MSIYPSLGNAACLLIVLILFPIPSFAQFEEYNYFSESEIGEINSPLQIDSEYFSDILTYRMPLSADNSFHRSERVYDLSIGSLSASRFATQHRLKVDTNLNDSLTFRVAYFEKKDLEQSLNHMILELQYKMNSLISLVGYTELVSEKKWNDFGLATLVNLSNDHVLRLYVTAVDSAFTKRTEINEKDESSPYVYGLVGRLLDSEREDIFLEYYARVQSPLQRRFLDRQSEYSYKETRVGSRGRQHLFSDSDYFNFDLNYKRREEGQLALGSSVAESRIWSSHQWDALLQYENLKWIYGIAANIREWQSEGADVQSQTYLPHLWYKLRNESAEKENLRLGYELSWNHADGPMQFRTPEDRNREFEHRGNLVYILHFNRNAFFNLLLTADLDDLSWEGGNGTLQIFF